jgi:3-oxoacyl-[acyl-carrier-protein] synthase III
MGIKITNMYSSCHRNGSAPDTVLALASQSLAPLLANGAPNTISHVIVATTCPDTLAPTLGQALNQHFHPRLENAHVIDLVQGCAGGVSAMILASQLSEFSRTNSLVVLADAARQSVSTRNPLYRYFGNGSFACTVEPSASGRLIHCKSHQYEHLSELVTIKLGHRAHQEILAAGERALSHPVDLLGLSMDRNLAMRLLAHARQFYNEFVSECGEQADIMVFHQVNPDIIRMLSKVFSSKSCEVIDLSTTIGNCGAASFGIALAQIQHRITSRKVLLCSFGTGGVITAGLWQF